jgi:ferric-chelate reductase
MYAFTIILFVCAILQSPRFIARLYASLPGRKSQVQSDLPPPSAIPHSAIALTHSRQQVQRQVGGGGVFSGWFLQKGKLPTGLFSPTIESKEAFSDYGGDVQSPGTGPASSETPSLLPPPHINPILNHLPFARWVHGAPFLSLPAPFGSLMHMPQLFVIGLYLAVCFTALLWKTNPLPPTAARPYGNDFQRSGLVGMVQIPLVIALGVRGNIIGLCVGKGYERLKTFHKIVGRVCFLATGMHVAFWSRSLFILTCTSTDVVAAKWVWMGKFGAFSMKTSIVWAWVGWAGLVLIVVTSLPWVRKKWFTLFEFCHTIGIISFLMGTALHVRVAKPWW